MKLPIKVLIVEDQRMFREGIRNRLEQESDILVVGEAASAEEALGLLAQVQPSVAIVDIRLRGMSGLELVRLLRQQHPHLKLLVLTGYDFDQYVRAAVRLGIDGYLLKDAPQETLVQAVREVAEGGAVLPSPIASKVIRSYSQERPAIGRSQPDELTLREIDVVELMSQGLRNMEIAQHLSISAKTVESHVASIMSKLGAGSRTEAVRVAVERGLIK
ncbi:MAG: response regulator transcription factor [Chloroflexi bacterium]|nr:response regulator transcription factor [Chloroflexota bacterium]